MIQGRLKKELTIDSVLNLISAYDIFKFYMPVRDWKLNKPTNSPFRKDEHPSFVIGNKYGNLYYIDFANTSSRGDCFDFVREMYGLKSIYDVIIKIDGDFGLGLSSNIIKDYKKIISEYKQPTIEKRYSLIQIQTRKFTKEELAYWNTYHIDIEELRKNNIYSIKKLYLNKQLFPLKDTELRFGYFYNGHWKTYKPFADKKHKWLPNNVPITEMDGKENIKDCDVAFIGKSKKDHMIVNKLYSCSCAVQNEGIACFSPENVEYIKSNSKRQILSFDADIAGVKNSQEITKMFGFDYCNVPKSYLSKGLKDWSDVAKEFGIQEVEKILKQKNLI